MRLFKALDLRFPDRKKENEYMSIKRENIGQDFHVYSGVSKSGIAAAITVLILLLLHIFRFLLKKTTQYIIILVLFTYNIYRLVIINWDYYITARANLFFGGYTYAVFQMVLISRIPYTSLRILAVVICYILRYSIFVCVIEKEAAQPGLFIRGALIDLFMLYYFHSGEKTDRRVFMNFDQKREELLKFKELLADSLPLGITVVDCDTLKPLFSNSAFFSLFSTSQTVPNPFPLSNPQNGFSRSEENESTVYLDSLYGDESTIRDIGKKQPELNVSMMSNNYICLKDVIKGLLQDSGLDNKAVCLTASYRDQDNPKSFNVTLKKIMWNGKDAIAVVLNDVTYQEKLMYLKLANANKDKVIATVSHELRTPLNGIIGLLDMAKKKIEQPEALEFISLCKDNAHLLLSLVNSMLDLHQISAGKLKLNISSTNIRKCIKGVLQLFHFQINQKGISLTFSVTDDVPQTINTDENRLKQIIINLIGNAIKFTVQGGIKVTVANNLEDPNFLTVSVSDTGMGIKDEDKNKLFQMFGKLEDIEGVNKSGVGLGLTISNALAGMLIGTGEEKAIQVTSQFGEGSTFSFNILKDLKKSELPSKKTEERNENRICENMVEQTSNLTKNNEPNLRTHSEEELFEKSIGIEKDSIDETSIQFEDLPSKLKRYQTLERINMCSTAHSYLPTSPIKEISQKEEFEDEDNEINKKRSNSRNQLFIKNLEEENPMTIRKKAQSLDNIPDKGCILIVDDNPFNLLVAENLVKETGYSVKTAIGGFEAIKQMEKFTRESTVAKAILMDCQMPVMDGYETTQILLGMLKEGKIAKVPIIAMTANNSQEDIQRCYENGMVGHLTKPTSKKELIEELSKLNS